MKKIVYIWLLPIVVLLTGCEVESSDGGHPRTLQGRVAYEAVESSLYQSVSLLDLMCKIDHYAQAPAEDKAGIKNYYLVKYSISSTGNTWTLKDEYQEVVFTHNGKSLNESGAVWTAKVRATSWEREEVVIIEDKDFRVESYGDKDWKLITSNLPNYDYVNTYYFYGFTGNMSHAAISIKGTMAHDKSPNLYDFSLEAGAGDLNYWPTQIHYDIVQAITYTYSSSYYAALTPITGKLAITADKDEIGVVIKASTFDITFNGLTESYSK